MTQLRSSDAALVIEPREFLPRRALRDRCFRFRVQLCDLLRVGLFAVEDRGDVTDCTWWRDESTRQRVCLLGHFLAWALFCRRRHRHVGAAIGGIKRRDHAFTHLRRGLGPAGFTALAAAAAHAGLDEGPTDRGPTILDRLFLGQGEDRLTAGQSEAGGHSENPELAPYSHRTSPLGSRPMPGKEYLIPPARGQA